MRRPPPPSGSSSPASPLMVGGRGRAGGGQGASFPQPWAPGSPPHFLRDSHTWSGQNRKENVDQNTVAHDYILQINF